MYYESRDAKALLVDGNHKNQFGNVANHIDEMNLELRTCRVKYTNHSSCTTPGIARSFFLNARQGGFFPSVRVTKKVWQSETIELATYLTVT